MATPAPTGGSTPSDPSGSRHAHYGEHWGEGAARCFSIEGLSDTDILNEDHAVRLMPVPDSFVCPISAAIMKDPVATVDGCVYEREYIERWFRTKRQQGQQLTSPITGLELPTATLMPLVALQRAIEAYLAHRPEIKREHIAARSFEEAAQMLQSDLFEKQANYSSSQDKMKKLRQANKTLIKMVHEANARILELEAEVRECRLPSLEPSHPTASSEARPSALSDTHPTASSDSHPGVSFEAHPSPSSDAHPSVSSSPGSSSSASKADHQGAAAPAACERQTLTSRGEDGTAGVAALSRKSEAWLQAESGKQKQKERYLSLALPLGVTLALYLLLRLCPWVTSQRSWVVEPHKVRAEDLFPRPTVSVAAVATKVPTKAASAGTDAASSREVEEELVEEANPIFVDQMQQLRHGNLEEKQRAAFMLRHFAAESAENQIAIFKAGAIEPLVQLLEDRNAGLREEAARALWNLARNNKDINMKNQAAIGEAGAIVPLIKLLEDEVPRVRVVAAAVLNDLALDNQVNQVAIAKAGAITPCIELLRNDEAQGAAALVMAASLLQNLARSRPPTPEVAVALSGAIAPLVELLKADTLLAQEQAASSLGTLAAYSKDIQVAISDAGAIVPLVDRLKGDMRQGTAALALRHLAAGNAANQVAIAQAGAIKPLVKLLEDGMPAVRSEAANALWNVARENFDNQVAIVRAGAAIPLVALLKGPAQEEATLIMLNLAASAE